MVLGAEAGAVSHGPDVRLRVVYFVSRNMERGCPCRGLRRSWQVYLFFFKLLGEEDCTKDFWVKQAVKDYKKAHRVKDARRSVTFSYLVAICSTLEGVCSGRHECLLFTAAFSLAFYGAFRIGELVSPSRRLAGGGAFGAGCTSCRG